MKRFRRSILVVALLAPILAGGAVAQGVDRVRASLLREVVPDADRFEDAQGTPPVRRAYRGGELLGYVFLTSDLPPEERGYSGPVRALVGLAPDGTLTGIRVTEYHETYMRTKGDFLRTPGFQEQFNGKYIGDRFRVWDDVDGIARVSISVRALSRGIRDSARRIAAAYGRVAEAPTGPAGDVTSLSWFDIRRTGVAARMELSEDGQDPVGISLIHLSSPELTEYLVGGLQSYIVSAVERRGGANELILYVVDGSRPRLALQQGWSIEQDGRSIAIPVDDVVMLGAPWEGLLYGETSMVGVMILNDDVDLSRPLTMAFDRGPELGISRVDYTSQRALIRMAGGEPPSEKGSVAAGADDQRTVAVATADTREAPAATVEDASISTAAASDPAARAASADPSAASEVASLPARSVAPRTPDNQLVQLDFTLVDEETWVDRILAGASWSRVAWIALVLALASLAFFMKKASVRWLSLATTFVVLGYVDGGFLSVSHITSVIWVGPSALINDLPLLMMVTVTVLTVLLWGRIFCGFLCPFGALQDFLDRLVPARFKRELPKGAHRVALKAKYGILAIILIPALAGSQASIYQYFEPFGTVFFLSTNVLLWTIAGGILVASAIVPRFYCRYACPLGASLAIASMISLRRIGRVEQCDYCKVCELKCPTGAIDGPRIDFKECVRCNVCEIQLIERTGVCRHDMETIRPRLVQLEMRRTAGVGSQ